MIKRKSRLGTQAEVAILGAGPAGLAAGHYLSSRGTSTHTIERNSYVGGLCVTYERDGFRWYEVEARGQRWLFRELDGRQLEEVMVIDNGYRAGLAVAALSLRKIEDGSPYFDTLAQGMDAIHDMPGSVIRDVLERGASVVNGMADPDPEG